MKDWGNPNLFPRGVIIVDDRLYRMKGWFSFWELHYKRNSRCSNVCCSQQRITELLSKIWHDYYEFLKSLNYDRIVSITYRNFTQELTVEYTIKGSDKIFTKTSLLVKRFNEYVRLRQPKRCISECNTENIIKYVIFTICRDCIYLGKRSDKNGLYLYDANIR